MDKKLDGLWIPKLILLDSKLSLQEKVVLSSIINLSKENDCYASNQYFADMLGVSKKSIERIIRSLDSAGYIKRRFTYRANKQVYRRYISPPPLIFEDTPPPEYEDTSPQIRGSNNKVDNKVLDNKDIDIDNYFQNNSKKTEHDSKSQSSLVAKEPKYFVNELSETEFPNCHEAMRVLDYYKQHGHNIYTGNMSLNDWESCEYEMYKVDFDAVGYFEMFHLDNRFGAFKKPSGGSLRDFLLVDSEHEFALFYDRIIC